jgi:hypothetical protein
MRTPVGFHQPSLALPEINNVGGELQSSTAVDTQPCRQTGKKFRGKVEDS